MTTAWTAPGGSYPPYLNFTIDGDNVRVTLREPSTHVPNGVFICGRTCRPGGVTCNNYCNMAPEKGLMQNHPMSCSYDEAGATTQMQIPLVELKRMLGELA